MTRLALATTLFFAVAAPAHAQLFRRPVACDSCIAGWYYFDHDASGGTEDWNCSGSTYDGHRGSDFSLAGGNGAIDTGYDIVAAADGVVRSTADGFFDHCTACPASGASTTCGLGFGGGFGNHVAIDHGSYTVYYAHMRTGSVRVSPGERVTCGQVIGQIGSSGCTTGAHTHFEPRPLAGAYLTAFDPFAGSCSATSPSRWVSQGAHRAMPAPTCDGTPPPPTCPSGWFDVWTCSGGARRRCVAGVTMMDDCSPGSCESRPVGTDDVCDADGDGFATDEGDCDDHAGAVHPGASETCGDGVDQDCTGGDLACPPGDAGLDAATVPGVDAAVVPGVDAAASPPDGARPDGAPPGADGGSRDAALGLDGARGRGALAGGCSCRVGASAGARPARAAFVAGLAALAIATTRRRRARRAIRA